MRLDLDDRISALVSQSPHLQAVGDYHGQPLLALGNALHLGLLMVNQDYVAQGYWLPKEQYGWGCPFAPLTAMSLSCAGLTHIFVRAFGQLEARQGKLLDGSTH